MGVWTTIHVYQESPKRTIASKLTGRSSLSDLLPQFNTIAEMIGVDFFTAGSVGRGSYTGFCEDRVLAQVENEAFDSLLTEVHRASKATWVNASFEHRDEPLIAQINEHASRFPEIAGVFELAGVSVTAGRIEIQDEFNERSFHSRLMIDFWNSYSPPDCQAYAAMLLDCEPIQELLASLSDVADLSSWRSTLVVT